MNEDKNNIPNDSIGDDNESIFEKRKNEHHAAPNQGVPHQGAGQQGAPHQGAPHQGVGQPSQIRRPVSRPAASSQRVRPAGSTPHAPQPSQMHRPAAPAPIPVSKQMHIQAKVDTKKQQTQKDDAKENTQSDKKTKDMKKANLSKEGAEMMSSAIKALIYMAAVVVVSIFISIIVIRVGNDVFAFVKSDEMIDINIPEEADLRDVSKILHENSIIQFPSIFKFYGNLKKDDGKFIAGDYSVSPSMSYDELRKEFKAKAVTGTSWVTIPEGSTVDEIIDILTSYGIGTRENFVNVINNFTFDYWFINELPQNEGRHYRLEGYLFPDTYEFYNNSKEETVINKMLARFEEVFVSDYKDRASELGYSVDQIITIAALIEKEAGTAADYRYVSSVFHNRLRSSAKYPKLESDATVMYAIQLNTGKRPEKLPDDYKQYDSLYNTYKELGLPPGAIANPSASAIRYALYPTESNYYFFISSNSGQTFYASTNAEHEQNIKKVMALNSAKE